MASEIFESAIRSSGDLADVFEYDSETGYFYLYAVDAKGDDKIVDTIHVVTGAVDFTQEEVLRS